MSLRSVKQVIQPKPTIEGAGVKLQRAFGFGKTKDFDPFLLLDDFRNDNPSEPACVVEDDRSALSRCSRKRDSRGHRR